MTKADKSRAITIDGLHRLSHLAPKDIKNTETLTGLGITAELRKILPELLSNSAHASHVTLNATNLSKSLKPKSTVADITAAVRTSSQRDPASKVARESLVANGYSAISAAVDVATVVGRFKNVSSSSIAASDKLERWHFTYLEKRALAQSLNLFFKNEKRLKMTNWIHPSETGAAKLVANLISVVVSHNPH